MRSDTLNKLSNNDFTEENKMIVKYNKYSLFFTE